MDYLHINVETLIELIKERPVLWDRSLKDYRTRNSTVVAWQEICSIVDPNYLTLSKEAQNRIWKCLSQKWTNIRDNYKKYKRRVTMAKSSDGSKKKTVKKYIYSKHLTFLNKNVEKEKDPFVLTYEDHDDDQGEDVDDDDDDDEGDEKMMSGNAEIANDSKTNDTEMISEQSLKRIKIKTESMIEDEQPTHGESNDLDDSVRHVNFFKSILPSIQKFNDLETIQFQSQVLHAIQDIHEARRIQDTQGWPVSHQGTPLQQRPSYDRLEYSAPHSVHVYGVRNASNVLPQSERRFRFKAATSHHISTDRSTSPTFILDENDISHTETVYLDPPQPETRVPNCSEPSHCSKIPKPTTYGELVDDTHQLDSTHSQPKFKVIISSKSTAATNH